MPILGDRTRFIARVSRAKNNALTMSFKDDAGDEFATSRQKGSAGVLFGFKNGGKGDYTLTAGEDVLTIAVAKESAIKRGDLTIGKVVPFGAAARIEDGNDAVIAAFSPFPGPKHEATWTMPMADGAGNSLGSFGLVRRSEGFADLERWLIADVWLNVNINQPSPTQGAVVELAAPVPGHVGDLIVAATVDACMLGRGYLAPGAAT